MHDVTLVYTEYNHRLEVWVLGKRAANTTADRQQYTNTSKVCDDTMSMTQTQAASHCERAGPTNTDTQRASEQAEAYQCWRDTGAVQYESRALAVRIPAPSRQDVTRGVVK